MTAVEDLAPWVSLLAAALSIGYVVVREHRYRSDGSAPADDGASGSGTGLGDALQAYSETIVTAVTLFTLAALLQLTVDVGAVVSPIALWIAVAAIVFLTAFGQATGEV
jgi:hypothetical protein